MKVLESDSVLTGIFPDVSHIIQTAGIKLYKGENAQIVCTGHLYAFYLMSKIK
jgi:hypothetical protein